MNYYLVVHDVPSFLQHPDWIGRKGKTVPPEFAKLSKGDGIVYYCKEDLVITGTFKVASKPFIVEGDSAWAGSHVAVKIKPVAAARPPHYVPMKAMLDDLDPPLSIFPGRKLSGIKLRGKTFIPITREDFQSITKYVKGYEHQNVLFQGPSNDAGLGKPGNLGAMNYAPTSEQGVVALFVWHMKALGFTHLEFIRQGFPDACAVEHKGTTYERKYIEFEYRASGFRQHVNNEKHRDYRCDCVVCWENDYLTCPVPVIELKSRIKWEIGEQERPSVVVEQPVVEPPPKPEAKPKAKKVASKAKPKPAPVQAKRKSPTKYKAGIAELLEQGKLKVDQEIRLDWKGRSFAASIQEDGTILLNGNSYPSPSAAGRAARNGMETNGWLYWKHFDGEKWVPMDRLRNPGA